METDRIPGPKDDLAVYVRVGLSCFSLALTYILVHQLRLDHIWTKMMPVELKWFITSFFGILGACIVSLVVTKEELFHGPLLATVCGALAGYVSGSLGSIVAGHVRGGILFRLSGFITHPWGQIVAGFLTAAWLVGIASFLLLYLMVALATTVRDRVRRSLLCKH